MCVCVVVHVCRSGSLLSEGGPRYSGITSSCPGQDSCSLNINDTSGMELRHNGIAAIGTRHTSTVGMGMRHTSIAGMDLRQTNGASATIEPANFKSLSKSIKPHFKKVSSSVGIICLLHVGR